MKSKSTNNLSMRILAVLICVLMVFSSSGVTAWASPDGEQDKENTVLADTGVETADGTGLCEHHPEHTEECGYTEGLGHICTHEHDAVCGYREWSPEVPCDKNCVDVDGDENIDHAEDCAYEPEVLPSPCTHEHVWSCGFVPAVPCGHVHNEACGFAEAAPCTHEHDEICGYAEIVEGASCVHIHDASCSYAEAVEGTPCVHAHDDICGYVEAVEQVPCVHVHDDTCGYIQAMEGQPCHHIHDVACGYVEGAAEIPCDRDCTDEDGDGIVDHAGDCAYTPAVEGVPCQHAHDGTCGYVEATKGVPCAHVHDDTCGYKKAVEGVPCTHEHDGTCGYKEAVVASPCTHEHDETCGYTEAVEMAPCTHEHDDQCGYAEEAPCVHEHDGICGYMDPVEGTPCEFVCEICAFVVTGWSWVDPYEILQPGAVYDMEDVDWVLDVPGLDEEDLQILLPAAVNATLKNGKEIELPITWDMDGMQEYALSDETGEGEMEQEPSGFYWITAGLPEEYTLDEDVPALITLVRYSGEDGDLVVVDWTWVDPDEILLPGEKYGLEDVDWVLGVPALEEEELLTLLPSAIHATLDNGEEIELPVVWDMAGKQEYELPILWLEDGADESGLTGEGESAEAADESDLSAVMPEEGDEPAASDTEAEERIVFYRITAELPEGYTLDEGVAEPAVLVQMTEITMMTVSAATVPKQPDELHFIVRHWHTDEVNDGSFQGDELDSSGDRYFVVAEGYIAPQPDNTYKFYLVHQDTHAREEIIAASSEYVQAVDTSLGTITLKALPITSSDGVNAERFSAFSVSAGHDAATESGSSLTIKYRSDVHLVKAHAFYIRETVDVDGTADDTVFGSMGVAKDPEQDTAWVYTYKESGEGHTAGEVVKNGNVPVTKNDSLPNDVDPDTVALTKVYDTTNGLHTDKTASVNEKYFLLETKDEEGNPVEVPDGRTFDLELAAWYAEGFAPQVGLVLDASGSMAFASDKPAPIQVKEGTELYAQLEHKIGVYDDNFNVDIPFPQYRKLLGYYEFWQNYNSSASSSGTTVGDYRTWYFNSVKDDRAKYTDKAYFESHKLNFAKTVQQPSPSSIDFSGARPVVLPTDVADGATWSNAPANFSSSWGFNLTSNAGQTGNSGFMPEVSPRNTQDFTISFSLQQRNGSACSAPIEILYIGEEKPESGTGSYFHVIREGNDIVATVVSTQGYTQEITNAVRISSGFTGEETHTVSFVFSGDTLKTYWDGVAYGDTVMIPALSGNTVVFAPFKDGNDQVQYFTLDSIYLFDAALSESEVATLISVAGEALSETVEGEAFLSPAELALLMNPHNTDNSGLGWAGYCYFVYDPNTGTTAYLPLGYYKAGVSTVGDTLNVNGEGWYYASNRGWEILNNAGTAKCYYGIKSGSAFKDVITGGTTTASAGEGAAPDARSAITNTQASYQASANSPVKFYIDSQGYLRCFFCRNDNTNSAYISYVYEMDDSEYIRTEALQRALGLFITQLDEFSAPARVSAVRFSDGSAALEKLVLLDWTDDPAVSTGMLALKWGGGTASGSTPGAGGLSQYNYVLTGGTVTYTGLQAYTQYLRENDNPYGGAKDVPKYLILFTDGANTGDVDKAVAEAETLKANGYTIYTILLDGGSMNDSEYGGAYDFLIQLAGNSKTTTKEQKDAYFFSTKKAKDLEYTGNDTDILSNIFSEEILQQIIEPLQNYTVKDYIDPRFDLVDGEGALWHLRANGQVVKETKAGEKVEINVTSDPTTITLSSKSDKNARNPYLRYDSVRDLYYLEWENQTIPSSAIGADRLPVWNATVTIRAKEFFLGGNAVLSNGNEEKMNWVYLPGDNNATSGTDDTLKVYDPETSEVIDYPSKGFPRVSVNVTPPYEDANLTQTIFMGETLNATEIAQKLLKVAEADAEGDAQYIWEYPTRFVEFFKQYDLSEDYTVVQPDVTLEMVELEDGITRAKAVPGAHVTFEGAISQVNRLVESLHTMNRSGEYLYPDNRDSNQDGYIKIISNRIYELIKSGTLTVSELSQWLVGKDRSYVYLPYIYLPNDYSNSPDPLNSTGKSDAHLGDVLGYLHFQVLEQFEEKDGEGNVTATYPEYPKDGITRDTNTRKSQLTLTYKVRNPDDRRDWNNSRVLQEMDADGNNIYGRNTDYKPAVGDPITNDIGVKVAQATEIVSGEVQLQVTLAQTPDTALIGKTITYTADLMQGSTKVGTLRVNGTVEAGQTLYSATFEPGSSLIYEGTYWGLPIGTYTLANATGDAPEGYCFRALTPAEESAYSTGGFKDGTDYANAEDHVAFINGNTVTLGYKDPTAKAAEEADAEQSGAARAYTDYRFALFQVVLEAAGDLEISKTVYGADDHKSEDFRFTVTLADENGAALTGSYDYYSYDASSGDATGEKLGTVSNNGTVTLKHGQSIIIKDLPAGTKYTVTETSPATGYVATRTTYEDAEITDGVIEAGKLDQADFVNQAVHSLTIGKRVAGTNGLKNDTETPWTFTVELTLPADAQLKGPFHFTKPDRTTQEITVDADGKASFEVQLIHTQSVTIDGLPCGTHYSVTEKEANKGTYTTTVGGSIVNGAQTGDLTDDISLDYVNSDPYTEVTVSKTVVSDIAADQTDVSFTFTVTVTLLTGETVPEDGYSYLVGDDTAFMEMTAKGNNVYTGTITLKHGQTATIYGVPLSATVAVEEAVDGYFTTTVKINSAEGANGGSAVMGNVDGASIAFAFTNTRSAFDLAVSKTVSGNMGNKAKQFEFAATFKDKENRALTSLKVKLPGGSEETVTLTDGKYTFELGHDETILFLELPIGTMYTIKETDNEYQTKINGNPADSKEISGALDGSGDMTVAYENTIDRSVATNATTELGWLLPLLLVMILLVGCAGAISVARRRRNPREGA